MNIETERKLKTNVILTRMTTFKWRDILSKTQTQSMQGIIIIIVANVQRENRAIMVMISFAIQMHTPLQSKRQLLYFLFVAAAACIRLNLFNEVTGSND